MLVSNRLVLLEISDDGVQIRTLVAICCIVSFDCIYLCHVLDSFVLYMGDNLQFECKYYK